MLLKRFITLTASEPAKLAEIIIIHAAVRTLQVILLRLGHFLSEVRQSSQKIGQAKLLFHLHAFLTGAVFTQVHLRHLLINYFGQVNRGFFVTQIAFQLVVSEIGDTGH